MAISKKKSRTINVGDQIYRWKFDHDWKREQGTIAIQLEAKVACKLIITLPNWKDDTYFPFEDKENIPKTITPAFIKKCINEAEVIDWDPCGKGSLHFIYDRAWNELKGNE